MRGRGGVAILPAAGVSRGLNSSPVEGASAASRLRASSVSLAFPKPQKRAPKPRRRIARTSKPRQRSNSPRAVATRKADKLWSQRVRDRAVGVCEWCWDHDLIKGQPGTDAHHVFSRRYIATRHALSNGVFLCRVCHNWAHKNQAPFKAWFAETFPQQWAAIMEAKEQKA